MTWLKGAQQSDPNRFLNRLGGASNWIIGPQIEIWEPWTRSKRPWTRSKGPWAGLTGAPTDREGPQTWKGLLVTIDKFELPPWSGPLWACLGPYDLITAPSDPVWGPSELIEQNFLTWSFKKTFFLNALRVGFFQLLRRAAAFSCNSALWRTNIVGWEKTFGRY